MGQSSLCKTRILLFQPSIYRWISLCILMVWKIHSNTTLHTIHSNCRQKSCFRIWIFTTKELDEFSFFPKSVRFYYLESLGSDSSKSIFINWKSSRNIYLEASSCFSLESEELIEWFSKLNLKINEGQNK